MANYNQVFHNSEEINNHLIRLDYLCKQKGVTAQLVLLGGAAVALVLGFQSLPFRTTRDIDVNLLHSNDENSLINLLNEMNIDIVGGVMEVPPPEDFKDFNELHKLNTNFSAIQVYVPSPELLACSKLFSKREKDLKDLRDYDILKLCDKDKLLAMIEEYKDYMLNPNDKFVNVHELFQLLDEKGI